jgi:hypothetical protein
MYDLKNTTIKTPVLIQHETESVVSAVTTDKGVTLYGLTNSKLACAFILTNKHKRTPELKPIATLRISIGILDVLGGEIVNHLIREWDVLHFNSLFSMPKGNWVAGGMNDGVPFLHDAVKALIMADKGWEAIIDEDDPIFYGEENGSFFLAPETLKIDIDVSVVDRFSLVSTKIEFDDTEPYSYYHDKLLSTPAMVRPYNNDQHFNALNGELSDKLQVLFELHKKPEPVKPNPMKEELKPDTNTEEKRYSFAELRNLDTIRAIMTEPLKQISLQTATDRAEIAIWWLQGKMKDRQRITMCDLVERWQPSKADVNHTLFCAESTPDVKRYALCVREGAFIAKVMLRESNLPAADLSIEDVVFYKLRPTWRKDASRHSSMGPIATEKSLTSSDELTDGKLQAILSAIYLTMECNKDIDVSVVADTFV